jgi:hypothetical protein
MPTVGSLRKAVTTDKYLSQNLDEQPKLSIPKTNPYYKFSQTQQMLNAISKTNPIIKEELTFKAMAPSIAREGLPTPKIKQLAFDPTLKAYPPKTERTRMMTPKAYNLIKKAGRRTNRRKNNKKTRKHSRKFSRK